MKCKSSRGQVLSLALLGLVPCLLLISTNFTNWKGAIDKIRHQRETDLLNLRVATEAARALNAIAALNQGLNIARQRGYAVALALLTLRLCVAATLGLSTCPTALARLEADAIPFYQKLNRLGAILAKYQDEIADWASTAPARDLELFTQLSLGEKLAFGYPTQLNPTLGRSSRLAIRRYGSQDQAGSTEDEISSLASGNDLVRCDPETGHCESFRDILQSLGENLPLSFEIPPPYALEKRFIEGANRLTVLCGFKPEKQLWKEFLETGGGTPPSPPSTWALSETRIKGGDLNEMQFEVELHSVTQQAQLWPYVQDRQTFLQKLSFRLPALEEFESELAH